LSGAFIEKMKAPGVFLANNFMHDAINLAKLHRAGELTAVLKLPMPEAPASAASGHGLFVSSVKE
jgi:hypothetical protein